VKDFSFYDFVGVIAPGALVVFGLAFFVPVLADFRSLTTVQLGGFGIFVAIAYVAGHLTQAVGNVVEAAYWMPFGGMPTVWVLKRELLAPAQLNRLDALTKTRWGTALSDISRDAWLSSTREMYAAVAAAKRESRIDTFNAIYGLLRGIAAGAIVLVAAALITKGCAAWRVEIALAIAGASALYRMHRFAVHYARELFVQFLDLQRADSVKASEGTRV